MPKLVIRITLLAVVFSAVVLAANAGPKLQVAEKGTYIYWFEYEDADGQVVVTQPVRFKGASAELETDELADVSEATLYVLDKGSGNMAVLDYAADDAGQEDAKLKVDAEDFQYLRTVKLRVVAEDGPSIESALVTIEDADGQRQTALVTPADGGVALFNNVSAGETTVTVKAEGVKRTIDKDVEIPSERDSADFEQDIKVAGDVHTLSGPAVEKGSAAGDEQEKTPETGTTSQVLQMIAGFIFLAVVIAIVYVLIKAKGMNARSALEGMGVQMPEGGAQQDAGAAPGTASDVCQFCGQKKDANGNCACTLTAGAQAAGPQAQSVGPKLVGTQGAYAGQIFDLTGPSASMGRDPGNEIALDQDNTASRKHATITVANGDYTIRDEGSSNGTFVNGARITEQKLTPGDEIQVGGTRFRFEV